MSTSDPADLMVSDLVVSDLMVSALWPDGKPSFEVICLAEAADAWQGPTLTLKEKDLIAALRPRRAQDTAPVRIAVVHRVSSSLLRALRESRPLVLVQTGPADPSTESAIAELDHVWSLGPEARVKIGRPPEAFTDARAVLACAHAGDELEGLCRALGPDRIVLAMSPTPSWLPQLLEHPRLHSVEVAGFVPRSSLGPNWVAWARSEGRRVVVPIGLSPPNLARDDDEALAAAAAAQALERESGPVFPAPRVVSLLLAELGSSRPVASTRERQTHSAQSGPAASTVDLGVWTQARRALPWLGATAGMETPLPGLSLEAPTAAFLAQRALLRVSATEAARASTSAAMAPVDDEAIERAREVLRNSGERLTDHESKVVLRGFGLQITRQAVANSASGAAGFADRIGYPVVLKALSPDLVRRTEVGGVVLDLTTAAAVRRAYAMIIDQIEQQAPAARLDGVLVAEMMPPGIDVRIGAKRLKSGHILVHARAEGAHPSFETVLTLAPLRTADAMDLSLAVLAQIPGLDEAGPSRADHLSGLAALFLRVDEILERTGDRIQTLLLGPVRLLDTPPRIVTLDASIVQAPHLQGA